MCSAAKTEKDFNIVLITIDALRADHLSCYGYERNTSPTIDSIAEKGIIFKNAYAPSSWTVPSMVSLFTSVYPVNHGVVHGIGYKKNELLEKEFRTLGAIQSKDLSMLLDLFKRMVSGEILHRVDLQLRKKDGNLIWTNLQASLVSIGKELFVQAIFHDIDQHKKEDLAMQEELERLRKKL